jgi:dUTP pyrophosphatase
MSQKISPVPVIGLVRLPHAEDLPLPAYETEGAAGMDIRAAVAADKPITLKLGNRALIPTGFIFETPPGYEIQVRPRSGLAAKHGITCLNTPGTIDSDYRGEVHVLLINLGEEKFVVERGMRIAQLVVAPVVQAVMEERELAGMTTRGSGGFGSTGLQ